MEKGNKIKLIKHVEYTFLTNSNVKLEEFKTLDLTNKYLLIYNEKVIASKVDKIEKKLAKCFHKVICENATCKNKDKLTEATKEYDEILGVAKSFLRAISIS